MYHLTGRAHPSCECPPSCCFFFLAMSLRCSSLQQFSLFHLLPPHPSPPPPPPPFVPLLSLSDLNKLCCLSALSDGPLQSLNQSLMFTSAPLFPPDLESTIVCNCSNLTRAPTGNHGNSAPVCKNKTKVQQPLYYYCYCYYATFSNVFTKAAFIFYFFSLHLPTSHYFILYGYFILFPHFLLLCLSLELQKDS